MKAKSRLPVSALCCSLALTLNLPAPLASAADEKAAPPNMEEVMKKMEEVAAPGPEHKVLASLAGEWEAEVRMWMGDPAAPPTVSKGVCKRKMILGGRFLQEDFQGEMMGKKFSGMGVTGYDKFNKKYVSTWMDDMGTGILISEGPGDADGKVLTLTGKMDDPMTGEKAKPVRMVTRISGPDKQTFEMHDLSLGDKSKVMEITYTRKGAP